MGSGRPRGGAGLQPLPEALFSLNHWLAKQRWASVTAATGREVTQADVDHVGDQQLRTVLLHVRLGMIAATVFAVVLAATVHGGIPWPQVQWWMGAKIGVAAARILLAVAWGRAQRAAGKGAASGGSLWHLATMALLALDGMVWGVAGWRLMSESASLAALMAASLAGVATIATLGLQVWFGATAAYVLPQLGAVVLGLSGRGDEVGAVGAPGLLILLVLLLRTAQANSRRFIAGELAHRHAQALLLQKDAALQLAHERSLERDRFLAKVSHELRTPLHGMLGLARLLQQQPALRHGAPQLKLIENLGEHLLGLINDLLDVSRIGAGHFGLHPGVFDAEELVQQQADVFALRASEKGLHFRFDNQLPRPCWVEGDAARLRQVLGNLLGNAIKFTPAGEVMLGAGLSPQAGRLSFTVHDSGPGIAESERERIFQPFQQGQDATTVDGVGLGLTIAREIAQNMGDDILLLPWAEGAPTRGAAFRFEPLLPAAARPPAAGEAPDPALELPASVLVAEDDEVNALIAQAFLERLDIACTRVPDGHEAVRHACSPRRPDLVLMDCRMPGLDGMQACAEIRRQERAEGWAPLPVLALTATVTEADRQACLAAGMNGVLSKPFSPEHLEAALREAWARRVRAH